MLINITIPVYNEERCLASSVSKVTSFLSKNCEFSSEVEIVIADNASTDGTLAVTMQLD